MIPLILAVITVLVASALCSGTEAALFSVPVIRVRQLADSGKKTALLLLKIRENMQPYIAAIVILNNIANIVGSIVVGGIAAKVLDSQWMGVFSAVLTFLVIILSEIIPKTIGERYSESVALMVTRPLSIITLILRPLIWIIEKITSPLTRGQNRYVTNEAEIKLLANIGSTEGTIEEDESQLIQNIFKLNDKKAMDIMTPRVAMTCLDSNSTPGIEKDKIIKSEHSRIILINETPDQVVGVAFKNELLTAIIENQSDRPLSDFKHKVRFVQESEPADELLTDFQALRRHLAVVKDQYGGVSGVVTLEDVLEVLTGEIVDETDVHIDLQEFARDAAPTVQPLSTDDTPHDS